MLDPEGEGTLRLEPDPDPGVCVWGNLNPGGGGGAFRELRLALASVQDILEVQCSPLLSRSRDGQAVAEVEAGIGGLHGILLSVWHTLSELWQMAEIVEACYVTAECCKSGRGLEMEFKWRSVCLRCRKCWVPSLVPQRLGIVEACHPRTQGTEAGGLEVKGHP